MSPALDFVGAILSQIKNHKVAVLGGGSFGTAIAHMIASNNYQTSFWLRSEERVQQIQGDW